MGKNEAASGILSDYLKLTEPGYALLFEAPWGAGKTHFIKSQMRIATDRSMRYITLNGIDTAQAFRRALVVDNGDFTKIIGSAEKLANAAAKSVRLGDIGSLIRDAVEDRMIASLPETLVFDDLERCTLPVPVLIGLLNDFVEHRGKRVVLIAHSDKHAEPSEFNSRKEKLVGRTVHLTADAEAALPRFIAQLNAGRGKDWLGRHQPLVLEVFRKDGQENLRLLRHGLQDCARFLDVLEDDLFAVEPAIERLVRVFLTLTLPFASGKITADDLKTRNNYRLAVGPEEGTSPHPLHAIYTRHQNLDIFAGESSSVLPLQLGVTLIGEGYAPPATINAALRMTGQFRIEEENPLWRRMIYWTDTPAEALGGLIEDAETYLFETSPVEPGPYLHIADAMLRIAAHGGLEQDEAALRDRIIDRIGYLEANGGIPEARYGKHFGWGEYPSNFSFGGFGCEASDYFRPILSRMREAQLALFAARLPEIAADLLRRFQTDPNDFASTLVFRADDGSYVGIPLLHLIPAADFAASILGGVQRGERARLREILKPLFDRTGRDPNWRLEAAWWQEVRAAFLDQADALLPLPRAQARSFANIFPQPEAEDD